MPPNDGPIFRYLPVNNGSQVMEHWQSHRALSGCFCFDPIFELYLGCWPVVFPLITRRKLSIKSVKWDAMSSLNGRWLFVQILQYSRYWQFVFWGHMWQSISGWAQPRWKMKNQIAFAYLWMATLWCGAGWPRWDLLPKLPPWEPGMRDCF